MTNKSFVFFGTDEFAVGILNTLAKSGLRPTLIVTTPDQPKGRQLTLTPPPVKLWAQAEAVPYVQPQSLIPKIGMNPNPLYDLLDDKGLFIVASYGKIMPRSILELPPHGVLNVHPSLLPKYRGSTPLQSAILAGDATSGVTIMKLDEEVDHGPIVAQAEYNISDEPYYYEELRDLLAAKGGELLASTLPEWLAGTLSAKPQDHTQATFTKKIEKTDGLISLRDDPTTTFRKIRAYTPWPGAYFFIEKQGVPIRVIIKRAHLAEDGKLVLDRIVPEGKKEMSWDDFSRNL